MSIKNIKEWFKAYGKDLNTLGVDEKLKWTAMGARVRLTTEGRAIDYMLLIQALRNAVQARYHEFNQQDTGYLSQEAHGLLEDYSLYGNLFLKDSEKLCAILQARSQYASSIFPYLSKSSDNYLYLNGMKQQISEDVQAVALSKELKSIMMSGDRNVAHLVGNFLQKNKCDVNKIYVDAFGTTPLMLAAQQKNVPLMAYLIKQGADVNATGYGRKTALTELMVDNENSILIANKQAEEKRLQTFNENVKAGMELLISHGASIDGLFQASAGMTLHTPLTYALCYKVWGAVHVLLKSNAALTRRAVDQSELCKDQKSLDEAAEICDKEAQGLTPLMLAVLHGNSDACAFLLQKTSDEALDNTKGTQGAVKGTIWDMAEKLKEDSPCRQLLLQRRDRNRAVALLQADTLIEQALAEQAVPEKAEPVLHFFNSQMFDINLMGLVMEYAKDNTLKKDDEQKDNDEQKENEEFVITTSMLGANSY